MYRGVLTLPSPTDLCPVPCVLCPVCGVPCVPCVVCPVLCVVCRVPCAGRVTCVVGAGPAKRCQLRLPRRAARVLLGKALPEDQARFVTRASVLLWLLCTGHARVVL